MSQGYELIFLVLVPASLFDLWQYRVPNALHGAALIISLIGRLETQGMAGVYFWFLGIIIPFFICYFFYRCHMLGASDGKLFSVTGSFVGSTAVLHIMLYSLFAGAVMAVGKIILYRNGISRFRHFFQYISQNRDSRKQNPYYDKKRDGIEGVIPFSVAISAGVLWYFYRNYW